MKFLITAGPTREAIDPVRYLSNRSSGKMGFAIAAAAAEIGEVTLVAGPVSQPTPEGVERVDVESAAEMYAAVERRIASADVAFFSAAVADFRPAEIRAQKIKKGGAGMTLELVRTRDILGSARAQMGYPGVLVGFAAETENVAENARGKLERKGCDVIVANDVSRGDIGFGSDENEVRLFFRDGSERALAKMSKAQLGKELVNVCKALVSEQSDANA